MVKYWMKFVCRTVLPIDDQFVVTTLTIINIFVGLFFAALRLQSGGGAVLTSELVSYNDFCSAYCQDYQFELK